MRLLMLYAPALVLLAMAIGTAIGIGQAGGLLYWVLAISVYLHIRAERDHRGSP